MEHLWIFSFKIGKNSFKKNIENKKDESNKNFDFYLLNTKDIEMLKKNGWKEIK